MNRNIPHPCPRCGFIRIARAESFCRDCRDVDPELCARWAA